MAQTSRVLLWVVVATTVFVLIKCEERAPVITSVKANRARPEDLANISIDWTHNHGRGSLSGGYTVTFFFRLQTSDNRNISADMRTEVVTLQEIPDNSFSVTLPYSVDPFLKYTVQVAQKYRISSFGPWSQPFEFTLNATIEVKEQTARRIKVEWPNPVSMGSKIDGFTWSYSTQGLEEFVDKRSSSSPLDRSTTSAVLNNLQEGASYNITVIASPSDPTIQTETLTILAQTLPDKPSAAPQNLTGIAEPPGITLSWQPPPAIDQNGDIVKYEIRFGANGSTQTFTEMVGADDRNRIEWEYTIGSAHVEADVLYTVEVAAATEVGVGSYASTTVKTLPTKVGTGMPPATKTAPTGSTTQLLVIVIPVCVTAVALGVVVLMAVCCLVKVRRMAKKAARSVSIAQSQLAQQEDNNYTAAHIYEDPEAVIMEYRSKADEANNHTSLPSDKEAFTATEKDLFGGGYATLEPSTHTGTGSRASTPDSEKSSLCEILPMSMNTSPADYEKPWSTATNTQCDVDLSPTHSHCNGAPDTSVYTDLLNTTVSAQDYEVPVIQNGNATMCASPV